MSTSTVTRYKYPDAYTLGELKWRYSAGDANKKIELLAKLMEEYRWIPDELSEIAVGDKDIEVRMWIAKNGNFYNEKLRDKLANDAEPLVRAMAYENDHLFSYWREEEWIETFKKCDWISRLALVRNGRVGKDLLHKIFDFEDKELRLKQEEKIELMCAFMSNSQKIEESHRDFFDFADGLDAYSTTKEYQELWELLSKWPEFNRAHFLVYEYLGCEDKKLKISIFEKTENGHLRASIITGARRGIFGDNELIALGMKDKDDFCRRTSFSKADFSTTKNLDLVQIISGEDKAAIEGIANNTWVPLTLRKKACTRMRELGNDMEAYYLSKQLDNEAEQGSGNAYEEEETAANEGKDNKALTTVKWAKFLVGTFFWVAVVLYLLTVIQDKQIGMLFLVVVLIGQIIRFQLATSASLQLRLAQLNVVNFKTLQKKLGIKEDDAVAKISNEDQGFFRQKDREDLFLLITSAIVQILYVLIFIGYVLS